MSYERGYDDCPNSKMGTRTDALHAQVGAIVRLLALPTDWQAELAEMLGEDDGVTTLANRRARLAAERRRLKEAYLRGDFEEDEDLYRRALERIRRDMEQLPSEGDMVQIQQAAELLDSLSEVWDDADVGDQRDLTHLMLREVQVDVAQGRVQLLYPTAPFVPLFRKIPLLAEREMGSFAPVWTRNWRVEFALPILPTVSAPADQPVAAPFLPMWPSPAAPNTRISPALSVILKARRAASVEGGRFVTVPHPGVPAVEVDRRKWPEVTLQALTLEDVLALPADTLACLDTPLAVQDRRAPGRARRQSLHGARAERLLALCGLDAVLDAGALGLHLLPGGVDLCAGGNLDAAQNLQQPPWRRLWGGAAGTHLLPADQPRRSQRHRPATRRHPGNPARRGVSQGTGATGHSRARTGRAGHHRLGGDFGRGGSSQG